MWCVLTTLVSLPNGIVRHHLFSVNPLWLGVLIILVGLIAPIVPLSLFVLRNRLYVRIRYVLLIVLILKIKLMYSITLLLLTKELRKFKKE